MSSSTKSPKRSQDVDDNERPFKKIKVSIEEDMSNDSVFKDMTDRTPSPTITTAEDGLYLRRRRAAKIAEILEKKKARVSSEFPNPNHSTHLNDCVGQDD
jgi:hypothetical protein